MKKILFLLFIILLLVLAGACKTSKTQLSNSSKTTSKKLTQEEHLQNTALFLDGIREKYSGNEDKAIGLLAQCIKQNPDNDGALYEMSCLLYGQKKYNEALPLAQGAVKKSPNNEWYLLLLSEIYISLKDFSNAEKTYKTLIDKKPEHAEYYLDLADMYISNKKYYDAIKTYDAYEKKQGLHPEVSIQKEKLYLQIGKTDKAIEVVEALIKEFPDETQYYGVLADIYLSMNMPQKAFDLYQQILKIDPNDGFVHLSLADYYRIQHQESRAIEELKSAFANKDLDVDTKVKVLLSILDSRDKKGEYYDALIPLAEIFVDSSPEEAKAYSIYGDILLEQNKKSVARDAFRKVNGLDSSKFAIWEQIILIDYDLQDIPALLSDSKKTMDLFPEQAEPYLYYGIAEINQKDYNKAIAALTTGKNYLTSKDKNLFFFYSNLGDCYIQNKNFDLAFEDYEKALAINPNDDHIINNYAYYLALQNTNLDRALELAQKLVRLQPDNNNYEDTYAWVLYKRSDFTNAKIWIEKAVTGNGSKNSSILDHCGDIMYKTNNIDQAVEYWIKAKENGISTEILNKKIAERKLYE